jgi:hypothetical protein
VRQAIQVKGFELGAADEALLGRHIEQLDKRLERFDPAVIDLQIELQKQARRREFTSRARLVVMNRTLAVRRNTAPSVTTLIGRLFEDLGEKAAEYISRLNAPAARPRKSGVRSPAARRHDADRLIAERALLDEAMAGDRPSFDKVAETRLAGVRKVIFDALTQHGRQPSDDDLDQALAQTLMYAFEHLREKPERWSLHGWLAWTARKQLTGVTHSS